VRQADVDSAYLFGNARSGRYSQGLGRRRGFTSNPCAESSLLFNSLKRFSKARIVKAMGKSDAFQNGLCRHIPPVEASCNKDVSN
jgi:hypothetical protein